MRASRTIKFLRSPQEDTAISGGQDRLGTSASPSLYWVLTSPQRYLLFFIFCFAIIFQYCYELDGIGVLEPDEPRYAAIGQTMALTGDWITPHLWGAPWFEKPALIYWMTAVGTKLDLNADLAGRLPVVLLSLAFLAAWYTFLKQEFGTIAALIAAVTLASSAAWLVYSSLCLTDIPMAVFFSLSVAMTLRILRGADSKVTWIG